MAGLHPNTLKAIANFESKIGQLDAYSHKTLAGIVRDATRHDGLASQPLAALHFLGVDKTLVANAVADCKARELKSVWRGKLREALRRVSVERKAQAAEKISLL